MNHADHLDVSNCRASAFQRCAAPAPTGRVAYDRVMTDGYEDLTECGLSDALEHELVYGQKNGVFMWTNKIGRAHV